MGRVKGGGTDCLMFLAEVYERAGIMEHVEVPYYRPDFMNHQGEERYLEGVMARSKEVASPQPADIALFKWGRVYAHAGIVVDWPKMIHAFSGHGVMYIRGDGGIFAKRPPRFFDPF
jgi:cell wall-associated NlpC family hydrolase